MIPTMWNHHESVDAEAITARFRASRPHHGSVVADRELAELLDALVPMSVLGAFSLGGIATYASSGFPCVKNATTFALP